MIFALAIGFVVTACGSDNPIVECVADEDCNLQPGGECTEAPTGSSWCTYPDGTCPTGRRWSDSGTGDGLSGECVAVEGADARVDARAIDAALDAGRDGPTFDAAPPQRWLLLVGNTGSTGGDDAVATEPTRVYALDRAGESFVSIWSSEELDFTKAVAWGDYDRDGDLDFAVGNGRFSERRTRIYENGGDGTFSVAWTSATAANTRSIAWADMDGDDDLDLVAAVSDGDVRIYRNDGGAVFAPTTIPSSGTSAALAVGDFDADGDVDIAIAGTLTRVRVYRNSGSAFSLFWESSVVENMTSLDWGDYDNDSDLDLVVGKTYAVVVLANMGTTFASAFNSAADLSPGIEGYASLAVWFDADGDGDLDIAAAFLACPKSGACGAAAKRVFRNSGGTFNLYWTSTEFDVSNAVAVADYDNDGDQDLAFANTGVNRVYRNVGSSFSLSWTSPESETSFSIAWAPFPLTPE
jgi:hypothetical protein